MPQRYGDCIVNNVSLINGSRKDHLFGSVKELLTNIEQLQQVVIRDDAFASSSDGNDRPGTALLRSVQRFERRYEVLVWDILLPHLIRNAPRLAPETVAALRDNHQIEGRLFETLRLHGAEKVMHDQDSQVHLVASINRLVGVLRSTLNILEHEVLLAFDALPGEQRLALIAVIDSEMSRFESGKANVEEVARQMDVLDTDRTSMPILHPPHAAAESAPHHDLG
jgi:hypothetical protein